MKLSILSTLAICMTISSFAQAGAGFETTEKLKAAAIAKFIKEANTPNSATAKVIAQYNDETADGRNSEGTINTKVTKEAIQVVTIEAEEIHVPWHYGSKENGNCNASGDSATFMILLSAHQGVHYASEFNVIAFSVEAIEKMSAKILKDREDLYCEDLMGYEEGSLEQFGPIKTLIQVGDVKAMKLPSTRSY